MLAERKQLSLEEVETFSRQICALFFEHFTPVSPQVIHVFLPILKNRELNTWPIIHKLWQDFPECRTVVPVTNFQTQELEHYQITPETTIEVNHWGIPEPVNALRVFEAEIDTVLMPLLAFDEKGNRIGYGKGFYDRFLSQCRPDCRKVGLCYGDPVEQITGIHEGDLPVDAVVTPNLIYRLPQKGKERG